MPYFETGTPVPFTAADKVNLLTVALQGQHIGIVSRQRTPNTIDAATVSMLNNFTQQNLTDNAAFIGANSSATVNYMKMSWNLSGSTITDLVIGFVGTITTVPNNGQDLINALMKQGPLQYLLDQVPSLYDAYIIGNPPVGTYHQTITVTGSSDKSVPLSGIISTYGTEQQATDDVRNQLLANAKTHYEQALREHGYEGVLISATVLNIELVKDQNSNCKLSMTIEFVADTNKPILEVTLHAQKLFGPLFWGTVLLIALILSISVPILVADLIKSWTTKKTTITEKKYGLIVDPVTGTRTWGVVWEGTKDVTEPDYIGILTIAVAGVILIGGLWVLSKFMGSGRRAGGPPPPPRPPYPWE